MKKCYFFLVFTLWSCGYTDFDGIIVPKYEYVAANADIATVAALYKGKPLVVDKDIILAGSVTANDAGNNFYRAFIIQDPTGAIEVKAGMFSLHNIFYRGRNVAIKARGLTISSYNGVIQIGMASVENPAQLDYIANRYTPGGYLWPQESTESVEPIRLSVNQLAEEFCGRVVQISNMIAISEEAGLCWAEKNYNTYRFFEDDEGQRIAVLTSSYANFATEEIPPGKLNLTGILLYGQTGKGKMFFLKLRDLSDIRNV